MRTWRDLALSQTGVITTGQLETFGLSRQSIGRLVGSGQLQRHCRGIYVLPGMPPSWLHELWVASLRLGPEAVVSHRAAAALLLYDGVPAGTVELSVPHDRAVADVPGALIHRVRSGGTGPTVAIDGLTVTDAAHTLVDLAAVVPIDILERALETALRRRMTTIPTLDSMLSRLRGAGRVGPAALRQVLVRRPDGAPPTESDAETLFLQLVRQAGLDDPQRQVVLHLGGQVFRLDCAWRCTRLAVEIDGAATHATPEALKRDLRRQNHIVFGWLILRFTWADIVFSPKYVISMLRAAWAFLATGAVPASLGS